MNYNIRILSENTADRATVTSSSLIAVGLPLSNLKTNLRGQGCRSLTNSLDLTLEWPELESVGVVVLPLTSLGASSTIRVRAYLNPTGTTPLADSGVNYAAGVIYAESINADNITITGRTIRTASTGSRYVLTGTTLSGYDASNASRVNIELGNAYFSSETSNPTLQVFNGGSASTALTGSVLNGVGVYGVSINNIGGKGNSQNSYGGEFSTWADKAPLKLTSSGSIPTDRTVGSIAFIGGWLCFANGSDWFQSNGTKIT